MDARCGRVVPNDDRDDPGLLWTSFPPMVVMHVNVSPPVGSADSVTLMGPGGWLMLGDDANLVDGARTSSHHLHRFGDQQ